MAEGKGGGGGTVVIATLALLVSTVQGYVSWRSLEEYRSSFLLTERLHTCVRTLEEAGDLRVALAGSTVSLEQAGADSDIYSNQMDQVHQILMGLNAHLYFTVLGTDALADAAYNLENTLSDMAEAADNSAATPDGVRAAIRTGDAPIAAFQNACRELATMQGAS